jgi:peptidoglycan/xylan/chitin deacetylase (PgdA/CDA1 family)
MTIVSLMFHDVYASEPRESGFESAAADRYKLTVSAFDAQLAGLADAMHTAPLLAPALQPFDRKTRGDGDASPRRRPSVVLTFDDGGVSYYTLAAERLEARGWRGHCFVTTGRIDTLAFLTASQIRELDERGHLIGTHSVSHPTRFRALPPARQQSEWADSRRRLEDLLGHGVRVGSVPGGFYSADVARAAAGAGLTTLFTSEPTTSLQVIDGCLVIGRFAIRRGDRPHRSGGLVRSTWTRRTAWANWTAKALAKPLLGASYPRVAQSVLHAMRSTQ